MLSAFNELISSYLPALIVVLVVLVLFLVYLQLKGGNKKKEEKKPEPQKKEEIEKKEEVIFIPQLNKVVESKIMDPKTFRIHSYIMSEIRNLTTDGQELGFDYTSDYIQLLIADIPKVIEYYLKNFGEFTEGIIPVMPCIPENLVPPNQLIANTFMGGKCSIPLGRIKNATETPKKPYWLFEVGLKRVSLEKIFLEEEVGLTINEIIRVAVSGDKIWRNTSNYIIGTGSLLDEIAPIVFHYNHSADHPELIAYSEKNTVRDYYLACCKDRQSF